MGEIVVGLDRERIAALRSAGRFFWVDVAFAGSTGDELAEVFGLSTRVLTPLLDFREESRPSRKFHADEDHVTFVFSAFFDGEAVETHVLVTGEYILTIHREPFSLPDRLDMELPEERSERYIVYAVLEAMLATAFDELNDAELILERLQLWSSDLGAARIRMGMLRTINSRLSTLRRRTAPQRGIFERVADEIGRIRGLETDEVSYLERIAGQLIHLVDAIDAAGDAVAKLIDLRVNETIYWLTVVATIFLPLTFVTGFFGMNFGWMVKHITSPLAFLALGVGGCALGVGLTLYAIRRRGTPVDPSDAR
jgi:magnesium transporter